MFWDRFCAVTMISSIWFARSSAARAVCDGFEFSASVGAASSIAPRAAVAPRFDGRDRIGVPTFIEVSLDYLVDSRRDRGHVRLPAACDAPADQAIERAGAPLQN